MYRNKPSEIFFLLLCEYYGVVVVVLLLDAVASLKIILLFESIVALYV